MGNTASVVDPSYEIFLKLNKEFEAKKASGAQGSELENHMKTYYEKLMIETNQRPDGAQKETNSREMHLEKGFKDADANNDGRLSLHEFEVLLKRQGKFPSESELKSMADKVKAADGVVTIQSYIQYMMSAEPDEFAKIDSDSDGLISVKEMQAYFKNLGDDYTVEEIAEMISGLDTDGDGKLNRVEYPVSA